MASAAPAEEQIDLVDDHDHVIGVKGRTELVDGTDRWRMAIVLPVNDAGQVLLALRAATKRHDPGVWSAGVTGTVSSGDTYHDTAVRETAEELGLLIGPWDLDEIHHGPWDRPGQLRNAAIYQLHTNATVDALEPDPREIDTVAWFDLDELLASIRTTPQRYVPGAARMLALLTAPAPRHR